LPSHRAELFVDPSRAHFSSSNGTGHGQGQPLRLPLMAVRLSALP